MLFNETSISLKYKKIENLKKTYFVNEEILKKHFNEATVLPIPDEAPFDVPRIMVKTIHEHAQLNISPIAATFHVAYNDGFERNWDTCKEYICERMSSVFDFLNLMTDNDYEYIGVVSNIIVDDIQKEGARVLSNNLLKRKLDNIFDINIKYTFVEEKNMFVNIMLQNARLFKDGVNVDNAGELNLENQKKESIGAIIDINDRYGFNNDKNYKTSSEMLGKLLDKMSEIIDDKLMPLIERGEY